MWTSGAPPGGLTGELPKYSADKLDARRGAVPALKRKHVAHAAAREELRAVVLALDTQRRQAGGYALAYTAKAADACSPRPSRSRLRATPWPR